MALKFSTTPVRRLRPRKMIVAPKRKILVQRLDAIDQFGELPTRKRDSMAQARKLGHDMLPWHQRANDPAGRWNSFCVSCGAAMVVCTEAPEGFPDIYGPAFVKECRV